MDKLRAFLQFYLGQTDPGPILSLFSAKKVRKKQLLVQPGQICDFIAFIDQGLFRAYFYNSDNKELTVWFSFEEMVITDMLSYYTEERATFYIEAIEDSKVYLIKKNDLEAIFEAQPIYQTFGRKFAEEALTMVMQRMLSLQTLDATARYKALLDQPEFLQKIPMKYLATYLGVTDSSLSRIRKQLSS